MKFTNKIIFLIMMVCSLGAQNTNITFENISTFSGLSASQSKCIFQDSEGYLWIGTMGGGLNRYDGYSFTVYKNKQADSTSLIQNDVYSIAEDSSGNIWIATHGGISKYLKSENIFINYNFHDYFEELSEVNYHSSYEVFVDSRDRIWIGTSYHGALLFNNDNNSFVHIPQQSAGSIDALPQIYGDFTEDTNGTIWASAGVSGLFWYDENRSMFLPAPMDSKSWNLLKSSRIFRIFGDSENNVWVMTTTDLYKYITLSKNLVHLLNYTSSNAVNGGQEGEIIEDSERNMWVIHGNLPHPVKFSKLSNEPTVFNSMSMTPTDIYIDSFGIIWVSDWINGIYKHVPTKQVFHQIKDKNDGQTLWNNQRIQALCRSLKYPDLLFICSRTYKSHFMKSYNLNNGQVKNYNTPHNSISCMISNRDGTFWLGLWNEHGLMKWNPATDASRSYFADLSRTPNLVNSSITRLEKDKKGNLWIGTINGLYLMSPDEKELELIIPDYGITAIYFDDDVLWCGAYGAGLIKYHLNSKKIENFQYDKYKNSLSSDMLWDIYKDKEGYLWLATERGLNRFDLRTNYFEIFDESDGLGSDHISALIPGDDGNLWITAINGISRMHKDSKNRISFSNYDASDGLLNPGFAHPPKHKNDDGRIFIGGQNGLYYFKQKANHSSPPITHIIDFTVNGKSLKIGSDNDQRDISDNLSNLDFSYDENTLSIDYIGLHYAQPAKNRYSYYLEGFESEWLYSNKREIQYVNLDPGTYSFHLRAANRDGVWSSEEIILPININEPWWKRWYSYLVYFGVILVGLILVRQFELSRRKEKENKKLLEAENLRKSEELEEARQLQLSMLPKQLPQLPHLDIAVYMQTATEVGGDYYDFHVSMDGTLTVVIGDATGHGMKAGTMVTTVKSLFNSYAPNPDILFSFQEITRCIRQMNFSKLSMCMTMLKIKGNTLRISTAGMPPSFIFRRDTRAVEEHLFQAMPLGTMENFPYEIKDTTLSPGDTILLMSDGLPELENKDGEMYGYKKIRSGFEEVAEQTPEEIIDYLKNEGSAWVDDEAPDDDVTFVVIKVK